MAFNQFLEVSLQDGSLLVQGKTQKDIVGNMTDLHVYVGRIGDNGTVPQLGDDLLHRHLRVRQLDSPWTATFEDVPATYGSGRSVILIGVAMGDLPGGMEVWYERGKIT